MRLQLDLRDEVRDTVEQILARYQNLMAKHYNSRVKQRDFQVGDLVLRKVMGANRDLTQGKLGPNWEGPYKITSWQRKGTYHLETPKAPPSMEHRASKKILPVENDILQILSLFKFCQVFIQSLQHSPVFQFLSRRIIFATILFNSLFKLLL